MVIVGLTAAFLPQSGLFLLKFISPKCGQDARSGKRNQKIPQSRTTKLLGIPPAGDDPLLYESKSDGVAVRHLDQAVHSEWYEQHSHR
jgi:hypothetical protein